MKVSVTRRLVLASVLVMPLTVLAHGGATGMVHDRMEGVKEMKAAMKELKPAMAAPSAIKPDWLEQQAGRLVNASVHMLHMFPEGSFGKPSEALPKIRTEWDTFSQMATDLQRTAKALQASASTEMANAPARLSASDIRSLRISAMSDAELAQTSARDLYAVAGTTCRNCHDRFKKE